jgi:hypothetical protein
MSRRILLYIVIFILLYPQPIFPFQFEDYSWGKSKDEIKRMLSYKGQRTLFFDKNTVSYKDKILGEDCEVSFYFSPKSEILYLIKLRWDKPDIGDEVLDLLIAKHDSPYQEQKGVDRYIWRGKSNEDIIALDYSTGATELFYQMDESLLDAGKEIKEEGDYFVIPTGGKGNAK